MLITHWLKSTVSRIRESRLAGRDQRRRMRSRPTACEALEQRALLTVMVENSAASIEFPGSGSDFDEAIPNFTVPAGDDAAIVVAAVGGFPDITSVTFGGTALTQVANADSAGGEFESSIWVLPLGDLAADLTGDIVTVWDNVSQTVGVAAYGLSGVDQANPLGIPVSTSSFSSLSGNSQFDDTTVQVSSMSGDLVIDAVGASDHASYLSPQPGPDQTAVFSSGVSTGSGVFSSHAAGAANVDMRWTDIVTSSDEIAHVAVNINQTPPPDSFVVTTVTDENDGTADPGTGAGTSLREAIIAANADPNQSVITFDPSLNGTPILLTIGGAGEDAAATGDLDVTSEIVVQGNGIANTLIDAGGNSGLLDRVFDVRELATLTLESVTVTGGHNTDHGGGIASVGSLTIVDSSVSGNRTTSLGGGVYHYEGALTITNSTISDNSAARGGGITNDEGVLTITDSTISGNNATSDGGGIDSGDGTVTITNTTISGNSGEDGGGIFSDDNQLTIIGSTISGNSAEDGGGIYKEGPTTITDSTISGNSATSDGGGIYNDEGELTVTRSTISGNNAANFGGGILGSSSASIADSTISGNSAGVDGGGIYNTEPLTITGSTISGNSAGADGGGIYNTEPLTITNSTISNNSAINSGGGVFQHDDPLTVINSTIFGNVADADGDAAGTGGGIWTNNDADTSTTLRNTIVADNERGAAGSRTADDLANKDVEAGSSNNLIGDAGSAGGLTDGPDGNIVGNGGTGTIDISTVLETILIENGGPTKTHALVLGSPAIDAGLAANLPADTQDADGDMNAAEPIPFDQRGTGFDRERGAAVDIGAVESGNTFITVADATDPTVNGEPFDVTVTVTHDPAVVGTPTGTVTLTSDREGTLATMALPASGMVTFTGVVLNAPGPHDLIAMYSGDATFDAVQSSTEHTINDLIVVTTEIDESDGTPDPGTGAGTSLREAIIAANANPNQSTITFDPSLNGTSIALTIAGDGEEAAATGDLDIASEVVIQGNGASNTIIDASGLGDRVFDILESSVFTLEDATITGGSTNRGAGIDTGDSTRVTIRNSTITGNSADNRGGGLYIDRSSHFELLDSVVSNNTSPNEGGGVYLDDDVQATIARSTISGNSSTTDEGGGLYVGGGANSALVIDSVITGNSASGKGGGIYNDGNLEIVNTTISGNQSSNKGGGIYNDNFGSQLLTITNSTIAGNESRDTGGGLFNSGPATVISSTITGNRATGSGGGIRKDSQPLTLNNTIVAGNTANGSASDIAGDPVDAGSSNNLVGDASSAGGLTDGSDGNIVGNSGSGTLDITTVLDVSLADNGGPTLTHGLVPGSPALDAGDNALLPADDHDLDGDSDTAETLPVDQRGVGFPRIVNGTVDVGAVEGIAQLILDQVTPNPRTEPVPSLDVLFTVTINPATFTADDISLTLDGSPVSTSSLTISDQGGGVFRIEGLAALTAGDGDYALTLDATGIEDGGGAPLNGSRTSAWTTDSQFPPKTPLNPLGSLIYDPVVSRSLPNVGDVQNLDINLDPGQTITVIVKPDSGLQAAVDVLDPSSTSVGSQTATAAGETTIVQTAPVDTGGTYTVSISGNGGTTGDFTVQVFLNSAVEEESHGGPANDTIGTAEDINASFISLGLPDVERGAVMGTVNGEFIYTVQRSDNLLRTTDKSGNTLSSIDLGTTSRGLALDPTTSTLYMLLNSGELATLDPLTGTINVLGDMDAAAGRRFGEIEFNGAGNLYAITGGNGSDPNTLFAIDKNDVTVQTSVHTFGSQGAGGLAFNPDDGLFYRLQRGVFESIDATTGPATVTDIPISGDIPDKVQSMTYLGGGEFLLHADAGGSISFYQINTSGVSVINGEVDHDRNAHGMVLVPATDSTDVFAFDLNDGDIASLVLDGSGTLELLDSAGTSLGTAIAGAANVDAALENVTVSGTGTYYARVSSTFLADYTVVITRNAAFDLEVNNDLATAQAIGSADAVLGLIAGAQPSDGFESGDFSSNSWSLSGDANWLVTNSEAASGTFSAQAGPITDDQNSILELNVDLAGAGSVEFARRVSSEEDFDFLQFSIDGVLQQEWSGDVPFSTVMFPIGPGSHTLQWQYVKDGSDQDGLDTAFIDDFRILPSDPNDDFSFDVTMGEVIDLFTQTPAGGPGEFVNLLDPAIELFDPTGASVATDNNSFVDGRNAQLSHTAAMTGTYVVRVSAANDTAGEYVLLRGVPDTAPPVLTVDSLSTTDDTPGLSGTVSEDTTLISVEVGGNSYTAVNNGDGTWTLADDVIAPALPAGIHNVTVTATDLAGNTGTDSTTNELAIAVLAFDFGAIGSPVEAGHTQVLITDVIPGTPSAGDFGWQNNAGISDRDRTNVPDDGDRDYHKTGAGSVTFQAVVPNGDYDVTFTIGSGADPRHNVGVLFEGTQVATISSPPGQFRTETHTVTVADGLLDLQLQRQGFTASGINSLVILPAAVEPDVQAADPAVFVKIGDPPVIVDPGLTVTDPDDVNLTGAEVRITAGFVSGQDVLGFTDQLSITGSYDGATGVLTLSGTASVADYQTALRSVTFATTGTIDGPRTVQFAASDATGTGFDARSVNVTPAGGTMLDFDFGTAGSPVATGFTAVEIDDAFNSTDGYGWLNDAVANNISARDRSAPDAERQDYHKVGSGSMTFAVNLPNGTYDVTVTIGSNVDPRNGVGVFLENTQVDTVNTAASQFSTETHRVTVADGRLELRLQRQGSTGVGINSLRIAEVTTAPTVDLADGPAVFQNGGGAIAVDGNLTVDDIDSANLTGATVRIAAGHNAAADTLSFTDQLGITGSYDGPSGVLTLSGSASVADYQTALRSVEFNTTDNTGTRTVEVTVDDGSQTGSDTRVINVTPPFTGASYDFGTATSNVEAGFIGVDETTAFTSAQGYGWLSTTGIESRNRSAPVPLDERRDYNLIRSGSMTFAVSLPNGTYDVQVTVGSSENARTGVGILLEGTQVTTINTAAMNFAVETHQVTVTDNRLEIEIARQGPTAAGINAVVINQIP